MDRIAEAIRSEWAILFYLPAGLIGIVALFGLVAP